MFCACAPVSVVHVLFQAGCLTFCQHFQVAASQHFSHCIAYTVKQSTYTITPPLPPLFSSKSTRHTHTTPHANTFKHQMVCEWKVSISLLDFFSQLELSIMLMITYSNNWVIVHSLSMKYLPKHVTSSLSETKETIQQHTNHIASSGQMCRHSDTTIRSHVKFVS